MDATAVIVVLLFVATIFSSMGGKGFAAPPPPADEIVFSVENIPSLPETLSFTTLSEDDQNRIYQYITRYRPADEARLIAASILKNAQQYNVNPRLLAALMARESGFNPQAVSSSGAMGLGQLLPSTCLSVGVADPYDIDQNSMGTARYLRYLQDRFKNSSDQTVFSLAGYFEGPNAVDRQQGYKRKTAAYVRDILNIYQQI